MRPPVRTSLLSLQTNQISEVSLGTITRGHETHTFTHTHVWSDLPFHRENYRTRRHQDTHTYIHIHIYNTHTHTNTSLPLDRGSFGDGIVTKYTHFSHPHCLSVSIRRSSRRRPVTTGSHSCDTYVPTLVVSVTELNLPRQQ